MSCPNPTGRTGVVGQTWGGQGDFKVFACPSQPFVHSDVAHGDLVISVLQGLPGGVDMPRGNAFSYGPPNLPQCVDTNNEPASKGCTVATLSYAAGEYVLGRADYVAVVGAFNDTDFINPSMPPDFVKTHQSLFNYGVNGSLGRVPDGTSNTLFLSEFAGGLGYNAPPGQGQLNGWIHAGWATNGVSVAFGTCPDRANSGTGQFQCDFSSEAGGLGGGITLGGWHHGSFQAAFADGSVHSLRLGIDKMLLFSLAGFHDGQAVFDDF